MSQDTSHSSSHNRGSRLMLMVELDIGIIPATLTPTT